MSIPILLLEKNISENLLALSEELLDFNTVNAITAIEPNLWVANIKSEKNENFEVEIRLKYKKIIESTCDCQNKELCEHIVTAALLIRKALPVKKAAPVKEKKDPKFTAINTKLVLENADIETLKPFIRKFASANREFGLYLKLHFLPKIKDIDSIYKYEDFFTSFKMYNYRGIKVNLKSLESHTYKTLYILQEQIKEAFIEKNHIECFAILRMVSFNFINITQKETFNNEKAMTLIENLLKYWEYLLKKSIAPELKKMLIKDLKLLALDNHFLLHNYYPTVGQLLIKNLTKESHLDDFTEQIDIKINSVEGKIEKTNLLKLLLNIAESFNLTHLSEKTMRENFNDANIIFEMLQQTISNKNIKRTSNLFEHVQTLKQSPLLKTQLLKTQYDIFMLKGKNKKAIQFATAYLVKSFNKKFLNEVLDANPDLNEVFIKQLQKELDKINYSIKKRDFEAFLKTKVSYDSLQTFIFNTKSIDLLNQYIPILIHNRKTTYNTAVHIINYYLKNHIGIKSVQKIYSIFHHLNKVGGTDISNKLKSFLRREYGDRMSIKENIF